MYSDGLLKDHGAVVGMNAAKTSLTGGPFAPNEGASTLQPQQRPRLCLPPWALIVASVALVAASTLAMWYAIGPSNWSATPEGCNSRGGSGHFGNGDSGDTYLPYELEDCRGRHNDGLRILILDDLMGLAGAYSGSTGGHSWAGPGGVGGYEYGSAYYGDGSVAYRYKFYMGNGDGTGDRGTVHYQFHSGLEFDIEHTDAIVFIYARAGVDAFDVQVVDVDLSDLDLTTHYESYDDYTSNGIVAYLKGNADIAAFTANVVEQYNQEKENNQNGNEDVNDENDNE